MIQPSQPQARISVLVLLVNKNFVNKINRSLVARPGPADRTHMAYREQAAIAALIDCPARLYIETPAQRC